METQDKIVFEDELTPIDMAPEEMAPQMPAEAVNEWITFTYAEDR